MATTATGIPTAREYARSSKGKGGRSKSTDDQHRENLSAEREFGPWAWGLAYVDTGSASQYATKIREDFDRLTADLASRAFGEPGTILVLWEISRLSREMGVGTKIVDLAEAGGYLIHVTSDERTYNPKNYNDRHALLAGINDAEREVRRLSKRSRKGINGNMNAKNGDGEDAARPHGQIPYGFQREYAFEDGRPRPVRQFEHPEEAKIVRELFRRVLDGESIRAVSLDFQSRKLTGRAGRPFTAATLRVMLKRDAYRGYRVHNGQAFKASWEPIVDDETWHGVQALLADPTRRSHTGTGVRHVLSMIMRCAVCGGPMTVAYRRGAKRPMPPAYTCRETACVRIDKAATDAYMIGDAEHPGMILQFLTSPYIHRASTEDDSDELRAVRGELASKRADLKETQETDAESAAHERRLARREERLENEIKELQERERALIPRPSAGDRLDLTPGAALAEAWSAWESAPLPVQRQLAAELLSPDQFGTAVVRREADSASGAPADRIGFVNEDGETLAEEWGLTAE